MSFLGNIAAAQSAKAIGNYNASVTRQQQNYLLAKREVNTKFYNDVTKPLLIKKNEKDKSDLFVSLLRTGAEFRAGDTPYGLMLENNYNQAFNLVIADYNKEMDSNDQLNQSLLLGAKAEGQAFAGQMTARTQKFAAVGSLLGDAKTVGAIP